MQRIGKLFLGEYTNWCGERETYTLCDNKECDNEVAEIEVDLIEKEVILKSCDFLNIEMLESIIDYMNNLKKELR